MGEVERIQPTAAISIRAWTVTPEDEGNPRREARMADLPDWVESADEAAMVSCNCLSHKASIMVLVADAAERPERRNLLHVYLVRRRSTRNWVRGPDGKAVKEPEFYADPVMQVCVHDGFEPVRPWELSDGNPAGNDLTLVEARP